LQSDTSSEFTKNEFSWNKEANIMYIDQPAGVGYSYCNNDTRPQDCQHGDNTIGRDNLATILGFYKKYPEFRENDLYISGESYAGLYVPYTVNSILHYNERAKRRGDFQPNIKGMMVGNGVTNLLYDAMPA